MLIHNLCAGVGDKEVFDFFCQRYYSQYIDLREFYSKVPHSCRSPRAFSAKQKRSVLTSTRTGE
jgi:hypothetical protein